MSATTKARLLERLLLLPTDKKTYPDGGSRSISIEMSPPPSVSPPAPTWARYGVAVGVVALAVFVRQALSPAFGPTELPFITFFPAVAIAAWFGRLGPAILSIALSSLAANWFFINPGHSLAVRSLLHASALLAFVFAAAVIVLAIETMHRARRRLAGEMEQRLRAQAALSATLTSIGDGVIATDTLGCVTFLNPEAARLSGWTETEAKGRPLSEVFRILDEKTRQPSENPVETALRTGKVLGLANHTVLVARSGAETLIDDSAAPIRQPDGSISGVVLVFRDVTKERKAQETKAHLAAIVEHAGEVILTKNLDGIVQTWNASAERLFGYRAQEIIGKPATTLFPPDRMHEEDEILNRLRRGESVERLETVRVARNGRRIPVLVSISPLRSAEGELIGASKIIQDISELVAAREALVRKNELLATTLASIGDAVIVTDAEGKITSLNKEAERLTKWSETEALGRPLPEVFHIVNEETRAPVESPVEKVLRLGSVVGLANHTVLIARDGTETPIDDSAAPIRQAGGPLFGVVLVFRDFTDRKRTELTLRESEARAQARAAELTAIMESVPAAIWIARDPECHTISGNRASFELLQLPGGTNASLSAPEAERPTHFEVWHAGRMLRPDELPVQRAARGEEVRDFEEELRFADGTSCHLLGNATPLRDAGGRVIGAVATFVDITGRKEAEQALRKSEALLSSVLQQLPVGLGVMDLNGKWIVTNPFMDEIVPAAIPSTLPERVARWRAWDSNGTPIPPENWPGKRALRGEIVSPGLEMLFTDDNGRERWMRVSAAPLRSDAGHIIGATCVVQDIDHIKRAHEKIAEQAQILDIVNDGIYTADENLRITGWNKAAEQIFGYSAGEALGRVSFELLGSKITAEQRKQFAQRVLGGEVLRLDAELRRKDGTPIWIDVTALAQSSGDGKFLRFVAIARDITGRKRAEDDLRHAHAQLTDRAVHLEAVVQQRTTRLNEMIGDLESFSYSIVHDMRAPLRAMQGFAQLLGEECGPISPEAESHIRRIKNAAKRMDHLIQDGLNFSRIMRAELPLSRVDVLALIRGIIETYPAFQPPHAEIELAGEFPPVHGNEAALTQCISNLLGNAVKFVAPGVIPRVRVWAEKRNGRVRLFFKDNGIGIAPQAHEAIFQIFHRLDPKFEGTGIGLAIVKKAADRMGGTVGVESAVGAGSTFWVELAAAAREAAPAE